MRRSSLVLVAFLVICGCGDSDSGSPPASQTTITVHPGESIQAAVNAAPAGATIMVEPGTYQESADQLNAVVISKDGIQLIGASTPGNPVILENGGGQMNGIVVSPTDSAPGVYSGDGEHPPCGENGNLIHGFTLKGFTVKDFGDYGVYLACVDGFTLSNNVADGDQVYGLFPVRSHNGMMTGNEAENTPLDSALYVGQSDHVTLTGNSAHDNIQGMEIENSSDITATDNDIYNNTAGLIADIMPGLQKTDQTNVLIANNTVHDNNRPNTVGAGQSTSSTPQGTGIVVLGGSMVTVQQNTVSNNGFAGVIVASYCSGPGVSCANLDVDPNPESARVVGNQLDGNGTNPSDPTLALVAADLVWDNSGMGNCWAGNTASATVRIIGNISNTLPMCE